MGLLRILKVRPEVGEEVSAMALWAKMVHAEAPARTTYKGLMMEGSGVFQEQRRNELGDST